jgi:hypothetical protein
MALDIMKITAALNAYPWTSGTLTIRRVGAPKYCAVGLLLRYAGVPQQEIECAVSSTEAWARFHGLLESEYGIADYATICAIIMANDSAATHEQAIERVQNTLSGESDPMSAWVRRAAGLKGPEASDSSPETEGDDGNGCIAFLA